MTTPISPRGAQVIACAWAMFSLAALIVSIRLWLRTKMSVVGREDIFIAIALMFSLVQSIFMHLQVSQGGLGQRWESLTPSQILHFSKESYMAIIAYNASLCATKFSIMFLCLRIFDVAIWRRIIYAILVLLGVYTIWVIIYSIAPCVPISSQWDKTVTGWCFPRLQMWILNAAFNIITDFCIVTLPIPAIMTLQLPRRQKIGVSLIFALGFFICVISILRIPSLLKAGKSTDPTNDNCGIANWSVIEVNAAIVGACLSTLKPLLTRMWPGFLSSVQNTNTHSYYRHSWGADRTTLSTYVGATKGRVVTRSEPDDSSTTNVLGDGDGVELEALREKGPETHTKRLDDSRSDAGTERSMDR